MGVEVVDLTGNAPIAAPNRKRKAKDSSKGPSSAFASFGTQASPAIDLTGDNDDEDGMPEPTEKPKRKRRTKKSEDDELSAKPKQSKNGKGEAGDGNDGEKRLRQYRVQMPAAAAKVMQRATTQRMFVIDRVRGGTVDIPSETLTIAGSTGNVYTIIIDQVPNCDCPHAAKGNQCKHILFALSRVLRARENLQYQLALLPSELREIFDKSPIDPVDADTADKNRKTICDEDNCPICFMEFENGFEDAVYCKAACGNNIHKECFERWAASRRGSSALVTCPFCRSKWASEEEDVAKKVKRGVQTSEGYVNVAEQLGISTHRDYSTYHSFWVRQQARTGVDVGDVGDLYYRG